jgi:hypothetical protein
VTDPEQVDLEAWARLAEECEFGRGIGAIVRRRTAALLRAVDLWRREGWDQGWSTEAIDPIVDVCRRRASQLLDG